MPFGFELHRHWNSVIVKGFTLLALLVALFIPTQPVHAGLFGGETLESVTRQLAKDLVKTGDLEDVFVFISPYDLYDAQTRLSLPLASQISERLVTELTREGVRVLRPGADEETFMILQGTWSVQGDDLAINLKVMYLGKDGPEVKAAASATLPTKNISKKALTPDRGSWARFLVSRLTDNMTWHSDMTVHLPPFNNGGRNCSDEMGDYLAGWLRPALAESSYLKPLDPKEELVGVSPSTLRTRGTRGVVPNVPNPDKKQTLMTQLLNADAELKGSFWVHGDIVEVRTSIVDQNGTQLSAAAADIPKKLFPEDLFIPTVIPKDAPMTMAQLTSICVTNSDLELELASTRGEGRPYYRDGEEIRFLMRLNRPAWVYLFDLNPAGEAILLYPVNDRGHLEKNAGFMRDIEKPLILPEDGYSYELIASAPYGTDTVWAVASETPLDFPANMGGDWSDAVNLVSRLRTQGQKLQRGYAEARLELVTGR